MLEVEAFIKVSELTEIFCINEHWLSKNDITEIAIEDYAYATNFCRLHFVMVMDVFYLAHTEIKAINIEDFWSSDHQAAILIYLITRKNCPLIITVGF